MSHIIAGDPAPTNSTADARSYLLLAIAAGASVYAEGAESLLAEYDALKRAEELQAAANWLMSQGHTIAARDLDRYIDGGESRG